MALAEGSENGGGCGPPHRGAYRDYESRWTSHMGTTCPPLTSASYHSQQTGVTASINWIYIELGKLPVEGLLSQL